MFDAHSELVKVGTDSPTATSSKCTSLNSLDLIQPLWKNDDNELETMDFGSDETETINQKANSGMMSDENSGSEAFCQQSQITFLAASDDQDKYFEHRCCTQEGSLHCHCENHTMSSAHQSSCVEMNFPDYDQEENDPYVPKHSTTTNQQTVLTNVTIDGYVYTKLNHTNNT